MSKLNILYKSDSSLTNHFGSDEDYCVAAALYWYNKPNHFHLIVKSPHQTQYVIQIYQYVNADQPVICYCYRHGKNGKIYGILPSSGLITCFNSVDDVMNQCIDGTVISTEQYVTIMYELAMILDHKRWDILKTLHQNILYYLNITVKMQYKHTYGATSELKFVQQVVNKCYMCTHDICLNALDLGVTFNCETKHWYLFGFSIFPGNYKHKRCHACWLSKMLDDNTQITNEMCKYIFTESVFECNNGSKEMMTLNYIGNKMYSLTHLLTMLNWDKKIAEQIVIDFIAMLLSIKKTKNLMTSPFYLFPVGAILANQYIGNCLVSIAHALQITNPLPVNIFTPDNALITEIWTDSKLCAMTKDALTIYYTCTFPDTTPMFPYGLPERFFHLYNEFCLKENYKHTNTHFVCPVCLESDWKHSTTQLIGLPCGHFLCAQCWDHIPKEQDIKCPLCNSHLNNMKMEVPSVGTRTIRNIDTYIKCTDLKVIDDILREGKT